MAWYGAPARAAELLWFGDVPVPMEEIDSAPGATAPCDAEMPAGQAAQSKAERPTV